MALMKTDDLPAYMAHVGAAARAAATADGCVQHRGAQRRAARSGHAAACRRCRAGAGQCAGSGRGACGGPGRTAARPAEAHAADHRHRGLGVRADRRDARPGGRDQRAQAPAQRHQRRAHARAPGRVRHDLREPAQRHHRSGVAGHQERQRLHPARRLRGAAVEPGAVAARAGGAGRCRPAGRRGAAGGHDGPRRRGPADHHARICRCDHPARRQGPDRAHQRRGQGAGDQAPGRQLPRLCR